jgi:hypothetical protein
MRYEFFIKNFRFACLRTSDFCIPDIIPGCDLAKLMARWAMWRDESCFACRSLVRKKQFLRQFTWALPFMTIFALIGTNAEFVGCVCGPEPWRASSDKLGLLGLKL